MILLTQLGSILRAKVLLLFFLSFHVIFTQYRFDVTFNVNFKYVEIKCQLDATDDIYCRFYCLLNMFRAPLCPSSGTREYYTSGCCLWYLVLWFSSCRYGVELRVMCPVCRLLQQQHNPQLHTYRQLENQIIKYHRQRPSVYYSRAPDDGHNGALNMLSKQ